MAKQGYDPAQLLRRSWNGDVDALAQELYVILQQGVQPVASRAGSSGAREATEPRRERFVRPSPPSIRRPAPERVLSLPPGASTPLPGPSVAPSRPESHRVLRDILAGNTGSPQPQPKRTSGTPTSPRLLALADVGVRHLQGQQAGLILPESITRSNRPFGSPAPVSAHAADVRPLPPLPAHREASVPVESPSVRQAAQHVATAAVNAHSVVAAPGLDPTWFRFPVVLSQMATAQVPDVRVRSSGEVVEMNDSATTEPERKSTRASGQPTLPLPPDDQIDWNPEELVYVMAAGITGFVPAASGSGLGQPGTGQVNILSFDGSSLSFFSNDPLDVFNLSQLPVGGTTIMAVKRYGAYYFLADRPKIAHGIVSTTFSACSGTTPGTGQVQLYYKSNGSMTSVGSPVTVENWYSIAAASGKHCAIAEVDGGLSLEVLDC